MTVPRANPFAPLIDAGTVLAACASSESLNALPTSARNLADRPRANVRELTEYDAAVEGTAHSNMATLGRQPRTRTSSARLDRAVDVMVSSAMPDTAVFAPTAPATQFVSPASVRSALATAQRAAQKDGRGSRWTASDSWYSQQLEALGLA
jgi:hypothetical protein